jgi:hypothetical protein
VNWDKEIVTHWKTINRSGSLNLCALPDSDNPLRLKFTDRLQIIDFRATPSEALF